LFICHSSSFIQHAILEVIHPDFFKLFSMEPQPLSQEILKAQQHIATTLLDNVHPWIFVGLICLTCIVCLFIANATSRKTLANFLRRDIGVSVARTPKVIKELKRKGFHFGGLVIPVVYLLGLKYTEWFTRDVGSLILAVISGGYFVAELLRLYHPWVRRMWVEKLGFMMREKEKDHFTGSLFYLLGCTFVVWFFSAPVAISAILFLIIGDFMAALVGISFGRIKIGRKSLEGSVACFISCFVIAFALFWNVSLGEQLAFWGALAATLTELLNPSWVDDNLSIPCMSGLAIQLIARRLQVTIPDAV